MFKNVNGLYDYCEECPHFQSNWEDGISRCNYDNTLRELVEGDESQCRWIIDACNELHVLEEKTKKWEELLR